MEQIRKFLDMERKGTTTWSRSTLHRWLVEHYGYRLKTGALHQHIRVCEGASAKA